MQTLKKHSLLTEIEKKCSPSHFLVSPTGWWAAGCSDRRSVSPSQTERRNGSTVVKSRSLFLPLYRVCRFKQSIATLRTDRIPLGIRLVYPRAPNVSFHFRELCDGAARRVAVSGGFALVSLQSLYAAAAGVQLLQRSIPSHWC